MAPRSFRFASFTLDLDRLCLRSPSGEMKLRPKSFEVLRYLVENARRVVSKDEVIDTVWSGVAVTEESLTRCISEVRRALGDESQEIVKTVPKRGYLFDLPVESVDAAAQAPSSDAQSTKSGSRGPVTSDEAAPPETARSRNAQRRQLTVMV